MNADSVPERSAKATPQIRYEQRMSQKVVARPKNVTAAANAVAAAKSVGLRPQRSAIAAAGIWRRMMLIQNGTSMSVTWPRVRPRSSVREMIQMGHQSWKLRKKWKTQYFQTLARMGE